MISTSREAVYVNWYVLGKEYGLTNNVRNALNQIYYYMSKKGYDKTESVYKTHTYYKYKKGVVLETEFLWRQYNIRQAYIKNAKEEYKAWSINMRKIQCGIVEELPLCACGCGERVIKKGNMYINGHNTRCRDKNKSDELASNMRMRRKQKKGGVVIYIDDAIKSLRTLRTVENS